MRRLSTLAAALVLLGLNVGCTRNLTGHEQIRLVIPFNGNNSSLSAGDMLKFATVNVQITGKPAIVKEYDFDDAPVAWGTPLEFSMDVPSGVSIMVQFMGVFETAGGASYLITYGDNTTTVTGAGTVINIQALPAGTANKEGRVAGRYFNSSTSGPTGTLVSYFSPPNGKPKMAVAKSPIVAGWFNTLVLDNIPMTAMIAESGITIFSALTINSPALVPATNLVKITTAPYYRKEHRENNAASVMPRVGGVYYLGYFKDANGPSLSGYRSCYLMGVEGLKGWYGTYAATTLSNPLVYSPYWSAYSGVSVTSGGHSVSPAPFYAGTDCDMGGNDLIVYPNKFADNGGDGVAGFNPPFRLIDPYESNGGFLRARFVDGSPNKISLKWKYLPGTAPGAAGSPIAGVDILKKYIGNGGWSGGGDDQTCEKYMADGYAITGSLTTSASNYDYTDVTGALTTSNYHGYQFAVCAFSMVNTKKVYVGEPINTTCIGGCSGAMENFGWGVGDATVSTSNYAETALGVHYGGVTGTDATTSDLYTTVMVQTAGSPQEFDAGDLGGEVMIQVMAAGNSYDCGYNQGQPISVGTKVFTKILGAGATYIQIPKGSFVDELSNINLNASAITGNFCAVQAVKVAHFRNLTLDANLQAMNFSYTTGGGIIPFRVSGLLSIAAGVTIDAGGKGFSEGQSGFSGSGHTKKTASSAKSGNSGGAYASNVYGGGAGPNAQGGMGTDGGMTLTGAGGQAPFGNMGGGGGNYYDGGTLMFGGGGGGYGGAGGGAVFVVARNVIAGITDSVINTSSGVGSGDSYGGGGGGSIVFMAEKISGALNLVSSGGATASGANKGGAGGGGTITRVTCTSSVVTGGSVTGGAGPATANTASGAFDGLILSVLKPTVGDNSPSSPNYENNNNPACFN